MNMKKHLIIVFIAMFLSVFCRTVAQEMDSLVSNLTTIDPDIRRYFPRWKICESDLQIQINQAFILFGYDKSKLNMQQIEVLAAPRSHDEDVYDILMISCGTASMNSLEIDANMPKLADFLSGRKSYSGGAPGKRDYCFIDIPAELPVTASQAGAIVNYLQPTNVNHAVTLSLFEQALKIGETGFWLESSVGTDPIGLHFWSSGEGRVLLRRPLYANTDPLTSRKIPNLLEIYFGGGYRITGGIGSKNNTLNWISGRKMNSVPDGKLVAGFDFNMPFHPQAGIHFNMEIPFKPDSGGPIGIDPATWYQVDPGKYSYLVSINDGTPVDKVVPMLRSTGQASLFYNYWLNDNNPENYFRFDLGMSYSEIYEYALYHENGSNFLKRNDVQGLTIYKPNEFFDWLYAKVEYRNQSTWPFGASLQYSNQILLSRIYFPLFGNWFYLEAKYSTLLRSLRPYEVNKSFFMFSPVIRLTI
jgi:hypothetical protein